MKTNSKYKSDILEAIHSTVSDMFEVGTIDKETMRSFDASCLVNPEFDPEEIKLLREKSKVSQPAFARRLNVSSSTVQKWESGAKRPSGPSLKLLSVVQKYGLDMLP
jgi:putative transcriptional regulator